MSWVGRKLNRFVTWMISPEFEQDVHKVQLLVVRSCRFLPTVASVAALLANPALLGVTAVAGAICAAVSNTKSLNTLMSGGEQLQPEVDGVIVEGEFI